MKYLCGRMKSDYQYSASIVYNNFPWLLNPTEKQIKSIEVAVNEVLAARQNHPISTLADLYNPTSMPFDLVKAHNDLNKVVDIAYRPQPFISEEKRMEFLFDLYEKYTADIFTKEKKKTL